MKQWLVVVVFLGLLPLACGRTLLGVDEIPDRPDAKVDARVDAQVVDVVEPETGPQECDPGTHLCGDTCVPEGLKSCGDNCTACPSAPLFGTPVCSEGICGVTCDEGYTQCGQACCKQQVAAGDDFSCYLAVDGRVRCWGNDLYGQLGDGTFVTNFSPTPVNSMPSAVSVVAGGQHACALTSGGAVYCWGANESGQLGDGTQNLHNVPTNVKGLTSGARIVAAGTTATCAVTSDDVLCWGALGFNASWIVPTTVPGIIGSDVAALAVGGYHACALTTSGGVKCWGNAGQVGDGTNVPRGNAVDVAGLSSGITAIAAGAWHTCAVSSDGTVSCWGMNWSSQLGVPTLYSALSPVATAGTWLSMTDVTAGYGFTCTRTSDGGVQCWGDASMHQFPLSGPWPTSTWGAIDINDLNAPVTSMSAGDFHTCAILGDGTVACWGWNGSGQLGDGSRNPSADPVLVQGL